MNRCAPASELKAPSAQIAAAKLPGLPGSKKGVTKRARKEGWRCEPRKDRGGERDEFHIIDFARTEEQRRAWDAYCLHQRESESKLPVVAVEGGGVDVDLEASAMLANEEIDGATGAIVVADRKIVIPGSPDFEDGRAGSNQFDQRGGATQLTADWRGTAEYEAHRAVSWSEFEAKPQRIKSETAKRTGTTAKAIDLIGSGLPIMESYRRAARSSG